MLDLMNGSNGLKCETLLLFDVIECGCGGVWVCLCLLFGIGYCIPLNLKYQRTINDKSCDNHW